MIALIVRPSGAPAAVALDQVAQRRGERQLVVSGAAHVPREREDARALRALGAQRGVRLGAHLEDERHRGQRLDVVDERRRGVEARDGGKRRLRARLPSLALERREERGLLAADVGAGAAVQHHRRVVARAEHVQPDVAAAAGVVERPPQHLELGAVLATDVDERRGRADRVAHDEDALDQRVRVSEHDLAVLERAGLGLVGVHAQVGRPPVLGQERRLAAGREPGAAAPAKARRVDLGDDVGGLHRDRLAKRGVAARLLVGVGVAAVAVEVEQDPGRLAHASPRSSRRMPSTWSGPHGSW